METGRAVEVLRELARGFAAARARMEEVLAGAPRDEALRTLVARSEALSERFREAQKALLAVLPPECEAQAVTVFRCCDGMRIACEAALRLAAGGGAPEAGRGPAQG